MAPVKDSFLDLERHTRLLEDNVAKLTSALEHWQLLEAEYEALLEDVQATKAISADEAVQQADLVRIRRDFDGQLVDRRTVAEILGSRTGQAITRTPVQVADIIDRRLDYVRTNAATLRKQVEGAANKLAAAQVISRPDMVLDAEEEDGGGGGGGGPITDIVEELDDDDNVVNVRLNTPSSTQPHVLEALKKAGIDEIPAGGPAEAGKSTQERDQPLEEIGESSSAAPAPAPAPVPVPVPAPAPAPASAPASSSSPKTDKQKKPPAKKGVSFSEDTKPGHEEETAAAAAASSSSSSSYYTPQSLAAQRLDKIMRTAKDQETMIRTSSAVIPKNEPEDEATLRREMLEYSMSEIGPIVAQLDLEEGTSDDDEEYDEEYDEDDDDDDDDEDDFGRSKYSIIDEAYRERMRDLEKKLGVEPLNRGNASITGAAGQPEKDGKGDDPLHDTGVGVIRVSGGTSTEDEPTTSSVAFEAPAEAPSASSAGKSSLKSNGMASLKGEYKKVSFARALDIAPDEPEAKDQQPMPTPPSAPPAKPAEPKVDPLRAVVVERDSSWAKKPDATTAAAAATATATATATKPAKKPSRFRMAREGRGAAAGTPVGAASSAPTTKITTTTSTTPAAVVSERQLPKGPHQAPVRFLDQERSVAPSGPEGQTLADAIVERQPAATPREPDELDATLLMQETAEAYHRTRNRLIQQQGGFLKASEEAIQPLEDELLEEDDGQGGTTRPRRISKFKAARLSKQ